VETSRDADRLAALGLPVVDVAGAYRRPVFRHVTNDDFLTGAEAAAHLGSIGFQRFAFLGVSGTLWSEERHLGFLHGLQRDGEPVVPVFARSLSWWENPRESQAALAGFLSRLELPAALFACNDTAGLRATELAHRLGIAVPEGLAILGVDNEDILCELASPSLSSIMLDCEAIGFRAVVARAVPFIRTRAHEGIDVGDVVRMAAASRRSLEMRFRASMGRTIHDEIVRTRLLRAKRLLKDTSLTMETVSAGSGFGAVQRFHAAFKRVEGMSSGACRYLNRTGL